MLTVVVVDDEKPALDELAYILGKCKTCQLVGAFLEPKKALSFIEKEEPDLVFLDVNMPELSGLQMADHIRSHGLKTAVIFATACEDYALEAFEKDAVDYLLKPYEEDRVFRAVRKIRIQKENELRYEQLLEVQKKTKDPEAPNLDRLPIWLEDRIVFVNVEDIVFVEVEEGQVFIHTTGKTYLYNETLTQLEDKLPGDRFFRTHRGYMVNLNRIQTVSPYFNNTLMVQVVGSDGEIPVSRSNVKAFKERLGL